jgi:sucrose-phosphate synthase
MSNDKAGTASVNVENLLTSTMRLIIINLHGLFRWDDQELGANPDTGGQTRYVKELAEALGRLGIKVDIWTRLFEDCDPSYAIPLEEHGNVRILRVRCGGPLYARKELLWPVLGEAVRNIIRFYAEESVTPLAFHGHYAESGSVAMCLAQHFQVPLIFTGHSFGIPKRDSLVNARADMEEAETYFNLNTRITAETQVMRQANLIVCNSQLEVEGQIRLYGEDLMEKCRPIPPGVATSFFPFSQEEAGSEAEQQVKALLAPFLQTSNKPLILAIARPEPKKNLKALVEAYGRDEQLQQMANLAVLAGTRTDLTEQGTNQAVKEVITELFLTVDKYNLWGKVALPKQHRPVQDVPALYRMAARQRGVFINAALTEPFGLTLLEAAASGLPLVATFNGGPPEIIGNCENGLLVDPRMVGQIATALKRVLREDSNWEMLSRNGISRVEQYYSWQAHCQKYLELLSGLIREEISKVRV